MSFDKKHISVNIWMNNEHEYKNVINLILHKIIWISNDPGNKKMVLPNRYQTWNKNEEKICRR